MKQLQTYIKNIAISLVFIFLSLLLLSTLYYFDILSNHIVNYLRPLVILLNIFISSYLIGKKADKNGYLEGLKYGGIILAVFFLIALFFFHNFFRVRFILYDIILMMTSVFGSMLGINKKKN